MTKLYYDHQRKKLRLKKKLLNGEYFEKRLPFDVPGWNGSQVTGPGAKIINQKVSNYIQLIDSIEIDYGRAQKVLDKNSLQRELKLRQGNVAPQDESITIVDLIENYKKVREGKLSHNYLRKFNQITGHIKVYHNCKPEMVDGEWTEGFLEYLRDQDLSHNTIAVILKQFKRVCAHYRKKYDIPEEIDDYQSKEIKKMAIYLKWDEVKKLEGVEVKTKTEEFCKDYFLIGCYTGMRSSDIRQVQKSKFEKIGGDWVYKFYIQKSNQILTLPIHSKAIALFEKHNFKLSIVAEQTINLQIKTICKRAEINRTIEKVEFKGGSRVVKQLPVHDIVSTHTARRTFGRKFMEETGDIFTLRNIYGHSSIETTLRYIGWESGEMIKVVRGLRL